MMRVYEASWRDMIASVPIPQCGWIEGFQACLGLTRHGLALAKHPFRQPIVETVGD